MDLSHFYALILLQPFKVHVLTNFGAGEYDVSPNHKIP